MRGGFAWSLRRCAGFLAGLLVPCAIGAHLIGLAGRGRSRLLGVGMSGRGGRCERDGAGNRAREDYFRDPHVEALLLRWPYSQKDFGVFWAVVMSGDCLLNDSKNSRSGFIGRSFQSSIWLPCAIAFSSSTVPTVPAGWASGLRILSSRVFVRAAMMSSSSMRKW